MIALVPSATTANISWRSCWRAWITRRFKPPQVRPELLEWLENFREQRGAAGAKKTKKPAQALVYVVQVSSYRQIHEVQFFKASLDREGGIRSVGDGWNNVDNALVKPPQFIGDDDLAILRLLWIARSREHHSSSYTLSGSNGAEILERMVATGRLYTSNPILKVPAARVRKGDARPGYIQRLPRSDDRLRPVLQTDPAASTVIPTDPPWYIDDVLGEAGPAKLPWDTKFLNDYLSMPAVSRGEAAIVTAVLRAISPDLPTPPAEDDASLRVVDAAPVPLLCLDSVPIYGSVYGSAYGSPRSGAAFLDYATVSFDYEGISFDAGSATTLTTGADGQLVQIKRHHDDEKRRLAQLRDAGLEPVKSAHVYSSKPLPQGMLGLSEAGAWPEFMSQSVPELRRAGWRVVMANDFRFNVVEIETIDGRVAPCEDGWKWALSWPIGRCASSRCWRSCFGATAAG